MEYYSDTKPKPLQSMPKCSKYVQQYKEIIDKNGNKYLKATEKINFYDKIQEARETVELRELIEKYQPEINNNDLTKIEETIADFTGLPENLIEVTNILNNAKDIFEHAPREIKENFNNNFNEFLAGSQNGTLNSLIKKYKKEEALPGQITIEEQLQNKPSQEEIEKAKNILKGVNLDG